MSALSTTPSEDLPPTSTGCVSVPTRLIRKRLSNGTFTLHYITLHYITLCHFIRQLHLQWPMVHQQSHSSSPNASLKRWVFKSFFKVSVFVSSWRLDGREFHAFGPENEKLRSPNFSFNRGSSYRKLLEDLSLSRPGRSATDVIMSDRYARLRPTHTRCMSTQSL